MPWWNFSLPPPITVSHGPSPFKGHSIALRGPSKEAGCFQSNFEYFCLTKILSKSSEMVYFWCCAAAWNMSLCITFLDDPVHLKLHARCVGRSWGGWQWQRQSVPLPPPSISLCEGKPPTLSTSYSTIVLPFFSSSDCIVTWLVCPIAHTSLFMTF